MRMTCNAADLTIFVVASVGLACAGTVHVPAPPPPPSDARSAPETPKFASNELDGVLFGHRVRTLRDLDGDGRQDWAISAPCTRVDGRNVGCVLYLSSRTHCVLARFDGVAERAMLGWTLERIDDVDHDGYPEIAAGVVEFGNAESGAGPVRILCGRDAKLLRVFEGVSTCLGSFRRSGESGSSEVLLSSDTKHGVKLFVGDVTTGTIAEAMNTTAFRRARVVRDEHGRPTNHVVATDAKNWWRYVLTNLDEPTKSMTLEFPGKGGDLTMWNLSAFRLRLGDDDALVMSMPGFNNEAGAVFVHSMRDGKLFRKLTTIDQDNTEGFDPNLGLAVVPMPDLDGDGSSEIIVSEPGSGPSTGLAIIALSPKTAARIWTYQAEFLGDVGTSFDLLEDVDGDRVPDVLVGGGDYGFHGRFHANGSVRVLSGKTGKLIDIVLENEFPALRAESVSPTPPK
jgi:hypothetical protein